MEDKLGSDMIDGKFVDWDNMTQEELQKMKLKYKKREEEILRKINEELKLKSDKDDENIR